MQNRKFTVNEKVRVRSDYFVAELQSRVGKIKEVPISLDAIDRQSGLVDLAENQGVYWVEFSDPDANQEGAIDGAEICEQDLERQNNSET